MKRNTCLFPGFFAIAAAIGCGSAPPTDQNFSIPAPAECDQRQLEVRGDRKVTKIEFPVPNAGSYYVVQNGYSVRSPFPDGYYPGVDVVKDSCGKPAVSIDTSGASVWANPGQKVGACPKGGAQPNGGAQCYNFEVGQGGVITPYLAPPTDEQIQAEQAMVAEIAAEQAAQE